MSLIMKYSSGNCNKFLGTIVTYMMRDNKTYKNINGEYIIYARLFTSYIEIEIFM